MKTLLLLLLTCLPLCAATTYPMLSDTTNRTVTGGVTNMSFLNSNSVFTGTARWMGIVTLTNTGNIFVGSGAGLTGVGVATSGGLATNATIYGLTINTGSTNTHLTASSVVVTDANKGIVSGTTTADLATLSANQTFTGTNTFSGVINIGGTNAAAWATNKLEYYSKLLTNSISDTSFTNSTSETTVLTFTIPENLIGSYGKVAISGLLLRNPTSGGSMTWRFRVNGVITYVLGAGNPNAASPSLLAPSFTGVAFLYGIGSTTSYLAAFDPSANLTYPAFSYNDAAATNVLTITAQNGTASSANLCAATNVWLYVYRP